MTQTDVLVAGRMATDMLARELEQVTPSYLPTSRTNSNSVNFYAANINAYVNANVLWAPPSSLPYTAPYPYTPLLQSLPASSFSRTNVLEDLFFLNHQNQTWTGIGYFVRNGSAFGAGWGPVSSLYRFEITNTTSQFQNPPPVSMPPILPIPASAKSSMAWSTSVSGRMTPTAIGSTRTMPTCPPTFAPIIIPGGLIP
jgi:hypothetical protein